VRNEDEEKLAKCWEIKRDFAPSRLHIPWSSSSHWFYSLWSTWDWNEDEEPGKNVAREKSFLRTEETVTEEAKIVGRETESVWRPSAI